MPRGRKPKPTALKKAEGNPGKRALNADEPQLAPALPDPPAHLTGEALIEWNRVAPDLFKAGVLTIADRAALAVYCQAWADWVEACGEMAVGNKVITTEKGYQVQSPWVGIANRAMDKMLKFASEFGLTPASRTRIHAEPPKTPEEEAEERVFGARHSRIRRSE
jgi:P27 family predicted phage terminase small subunit